ncbi:hypothetical protein KC343_g13877 [Hortaea werneckii]|uniref:Uncharacterized protein n=1 Tax=Hortaea werneckii TaxID=91943 RepID=A0A3M7D5D6_HORWE|nr:hypothetical protein KC343_g13877 [Hortaea werneckii]KAI7641525.1 hypothetical protein KC319_g13460 [Hortaea werneckii]RMY59373.1 hypothetical protein D0864_13230 [Hortaea werneckii]
MPITPTYFQQAMPAISRPHDAPSGTTSPIPPPIRTHQFPPPKIRLHLDDLSHEGTSIFLSNIKASEDLPHQIQTVLNLLYTPTCPRPGTRSVTFILRQYHGLAYTTGTDLDDDHKEIHLNLDYIRRVGAERARHEVLGVICHELVHCFQWNAGGSCPGGLVEGMADYVRLNAGLAARHWKQEAEGNWDQGYQHTGFFLQWLEEKFGAGTVRRLNGCLREGRYDEGRVFGECCRGRRVEELWREYREELQRRGDGEGDGATGTAGEEGKTIPTDTPPKHGDA